MRGRKGSRRPAGVGRLETSVSVSRGTASELTLFSPVYGDSRAPLDVGERASGVIYQLVAVERYILMRYGPFRTSSARREIDSIHDSCAAIDIYQERQVCLLSII